MGQPAKEPEAARLHHIPVWRGEARCGQPVDRAAGQETPSGARHEEERRLARVERLADEGAVPQGVEDGIVVEAAVGQGCHQAHEMVGVELAGVVLEERIDAALARRQIRFPGRAWLDAREPHAEGVKVAHVHRHDASRRVVAADCFILEGTQDCGGTSVHDQDRRINGAQPASCRVCRGAQAGEGSGNRMVQEGKGQRSRVGFGAEALAQPLEAETAVRDPYRGRAVIEDCDGEGVQATKIDVELGERLGDGREPDVVEGKVQGEGSGGRVFRRRVVDDPHAQRSDRFQIVIDRSSSRRGRADGQPGSSVVTGGPCRWTATHGRTGEDHAPAGLRRAPDRARHQEGRGGEHESVGVLDRAVRIEEENILGARSDVDRERSQTAASSSAELSQRPSTGDPRAVLVPPFDVPFTQSPAEPDRSASDQGREIDQARADVAQGDVPGLDLGDSTLHSSHDVPHRALTGAELAGVLAVAVRAAKPNQLALGLGDPVTVRAELLQHGPELAQARVCRVDVVVARHGRILPRDRHIGPPESPASMAAMRLAARMKDIGTETAFEAAARARELEATGRDVIHLEIGEPDFDTPENIRAAAKRALDEGWTHYGPTTGLPELREAIAADAGRRRGMTVDAANVVVTPGAKPIMFYALLALIDAGDEVIYPDPGFPIYESMTRYVAGSAKPIELREENGFRLDPDELRALVTDRTRLIIFNSPQNPTGSVLDGADLEAIAEIARERDLIVLADEIYGRILYEGEHVSIASLPGMAERTIILDGFSKTYAMTGWRLGYGILPPALITPFSRLITNSVSCTSSHSQLAAVEALTGDQSAVDAMVEEFRARRALIVEGLNAIPGFRCLQPSGAFYVFPNIAGTGLPAQDLADRLLQEGGVSVLAGTAFGRTGVDYLRISYANSRDNIRTALERIEAVVSTLPVGATA